MEAWEIESRDGRGLNLKSQSVVGQSYSCGGGRQFEVAFHELKSGEN